MKRERNVINFRSECDNGITLTQGETALVFWSFALMEKGCDTSISAEREGGGEMAKRFCWIWKTEASIVWNKKSFGVSRKCSKKHISRTKIISMWLERKLDLSKKYEWWDSKQMRNI